VNPEKFSELIEISRKRRNFLREIFLVEESGSSRGPPAFQTDDGLEVEKAAPPEN
jgi:hypothetical protein